MDKNSHNEKFHRIFHLKLSKMIALYIMTENYVNIGGI